MTKRELIDEILMINRTAAPEFLARFNDGDLDEYLQHLRVSRVPRLSGEPGRYERYFPASAPVSRVQPAAAAQPYQTQAEGDDSEVTREERAALRSAPALVASAADAVEISHAPFAAAPAQQVAQAALF